MKTTAKTSFLLMSSKYKRTISFICLIALLSVTAGLLGNNLISKKENLDPVSIIVVDKEDSFESKLLFSTVLSSVDGEMLIDIRQEEESVAKELLHQGDATAVFVIPPDFFASVLRGENKPLTAAYNPYTPMQSTMIKMLVDQLLEVLKASQSGIYTTLDYTKEHYPEKYSEMYTAINARYINAALSHNKMVESVEISATGRVDSFTHYLFTTLIFLLLLGCCLYIPVVGDNFSVLAIAQLKRQNRSLLGLVSGCVVGWWGWYSVVGTLLFLAYAVASKVLNLSFSFYLLPAILAILFCFSALGVLLGFLFQNHVYATALLTSFSVVSLFFSGGIIPLTYLSGEFTKAAVFFPSFWGVRLLEFGGTGSFYFKAYGVLFGFSAVFIILTFLFLRFSKRDAKK